MTEPEPRRDLDWAGALIQGLLGGLANTSAVGAIGTALRDLAVQDIAHRTADQLRRQPPPPVSTDTHTVSDPDNDTAHPDQRSPT